MGIVDDYVALHKNAMTINELAKKLGITRKSVENKSLKIKDPQEPTFTKNPIQEEELALIHFIKIRKTGVLVEIAERRLEDINKHKQFSHLFEIS